MKDIENIIQLMENNIITIVFKDNNNYVKEYGNIVCWKTSTVKKVQKYFYIICQKESSETIFSETLQKLFKNCDYVKFNKINFPENLMKIICSNIEYKNFGTDLFLVPSLKNPSKELLIALQTITVGHLSISGEEFSYYKNGTLESCKINQSKFGILTDLCRNLNYNKNISYVSFENVTSQQLEKLLELTNKIQQPCVRKMDKEKQKAFDCKRSYEIYHSKDSTYTLPKTPLSLQSIIRVQHFGNASFEDIMKYRHKPRRSCFIDCSKEETWCNIS